MLQNGITAPRCVVENHEHVEFNLYGRCVSVTNKFPYTDNGMSIPLYQICLKLRIVCSTAVLPRTHANMLIVMSVRMTCYTGENMRGFHHSSITGLVADMDIVCKNFCRQQLCNLYRTVLKFTYESSCLHPSTTFYRLI